MVSVSSPFFPLCHDAGGAAFNLHDRMSKSPRATCILFWLYTAARPAFMAGDKTPFPLRNKIQGVMASVWWSAAAQLTTLAKRHVLRKQPHVETRNACGGSSARSCPASLAVAMVGNQSKPTRKNVRCAQQLIQLRLLGLPISWPWPTK